MSTAYESEFGSDGPNIAILSEYDALPAIGHSCGHNIIAVMGLGASLALSSLGDRLNGRIRYLGTPAEEKGAGKELMAQEGAFDGVDAAMMVHPAGVDLATAKPYQSLMAYMNQLMDQANRILDRQSDHDKATAQNG